jgi:hypothetical protein
VFSADRFNFVQARRADPASHSWGIRDDELRADSVYFADGLPLDRIMI